MNKLQELQLSLKRYNNRRMPEHIQKEITENWNWLYLWRYVDYSWIVVSFRNYKK